MILGIKLSLLIVDRSLREVVFVCYENFGDVGIDVLIDLVDPT